MPDRGIRVRRGASGQSLVEFALVVPMLLILVFGIIDFGMGLRAYIGLSSAAREGARFAAVGNPAGAFSTGGADECDGSTPSTVVGKVCTRLGGLNLNNVSDVSVTYPDGESPGEAVVVEVEYDYHFISPVGRMIEFFGAGDGADVLQLTAKTEMRLE